MSTHLHRLFDDLWIERAPPKPRTRRHKRTFYASRKELSEPLFRPPSLFHTKPPSLVDLAFGCSGNRPCSCRRDAPEDDQPSSLLGSNEEAPDAPLNFDALCRLLFSGGNQTKESEDRTAAAEDSPAAMNASELMEKHQLNKEGKAIGFTGGRNVVLQPSAEESSRDSGLTHSRPLCDYKWEQKTNYDGRILSACGRLVAYRLFNENTGEAIRVMERESRTRHLIKDFRARIVDVAWAQHAYLLAVLDAKGSLYIYKVDKKTFALSKYLNVICNVEASDDIPRLVWCPFIGSDEKKDEDECSLLGVISGRTVKLFYLNVIKEKFGLPEVEVERLDSLPEAMISFETDSQITAVRISPDATACAVATMDGNVTYYVIEDGVPRRANGSIPFPNQHVEEMFFLDNIHRQRDASESPWKHVVFVSDNGRRLTVFDSYSGEYIARLRFELNSDAHRLDVLMDDSARYLYAVNYDTSDVFCIELTPDFPGTQPYFVGCTQVFFSAKLVCVAPCALDEKVDQGEDEFSFDEDVIAVKKNVVTFVAISNRSLLEVNVTLPRVLDIDLNVSNEAGIRQLQEKAVQQSRQFKSSNQRIASSLGSASDLQEHPSPRPKEKIFSPDGSTKRRSRMDGELQNHSAASLENNGAQFAGPTERRRRDGEQLGHAQTPSDGRRLAGAGPRQREAHRRDEHSDGEKSTSRAFDIRREHTDNLSDVLEKIANEITLRDEKIEAVIQRMNVNLSKEIKKTVEATLNDNSFSLQSTMELSNARVVETVLSTVLVPSVDQICRALFHQLNENFKDGLQEFLDQVREELETASAAPPDYQVRSQVLENGSITYFTHVQPNQRRIGGRNAGSSLESVKKP
ncbi:Ge1-WD40 domain-containing protein [Aphelenchoides fujianensis]|nr:Ge1-WD40 domain-containing protein [Aphelenchoides fujianensis]